MKEEYVSNEIARLLKEKSFDEPCSVILVDGRMVLLGHLLNNTQVLLTDEFRLYRHRDEFITIPTQQMTMRWLREVHNVNIEILLNGIGEWYFLVCKGIKVIKEGQYCKTYEEATEAAIKYCLKNLV